MGGRGQPDGMSEANLQRFHSRRGAQKSVVARKSLFYNKLDTSRVDETITLKIAYYLISNDLSATPKFYARLSPDGPAGSCRKGLCAIAALFHVRRFLGTKRLTW